MSDQTQRARAVDPKLSCCVVAPAGSGKTSLLVQRTLALLARVSHPEHIVAITFTRKAAAEMRARIADAFEMAQNKQVSEVKEYERETLVLAKQALANAEKQGWALPQHIQRLQFMTIDSFCAVLVKQMPLVSRTGGQLTPAEPASELYRGAVLDLLTHCDEPLQQLLAPIIAVLGNRWDEVVAWLSQLLAKRDQWQLALFPGQREYDALRYMRDTWSMECQRRVRQLNQDLEPWRAQLQEVLNLLSIEEKSDYKPLHASDSIVSWRRVACFLLTQKDEWRTRVTANEGFPSKSPQKILRDAIVADLKNTCSTSIFEGIQRMPESLEEDQDWQVVTSTVSILPHLLASFWWQCQQRGEVDFTQIAAAALEALGEDDLPSDLALKLDYSIHHLLVDEFQDTSTHQFELIRRLTRGWHEYNQENPNAPKTLFVVGDAMQSIYRFRGAQVDLFVRAIEEGFNGLRLERLDLNRNFRSVRGIVDWVNTVFAGDRNPRSGMINRLTANIAEPVLDGDSEIEYHAFVQDAKAAHETSFIVERIKQWIAVDPLQTIAVLGRTRGQLAPIMRALKDAGIPFKSSDVERISDNSAVHDLIYILRLIVDPSDTLAAMTCLRAPWLGAPLALLHCAQTIHSSLQTGDWCETLRELETECDDTSVLPALSHFNRVLAWAQHYRGRRSTRLWLEFLWMALSGPSIYASEADQAAIKALIEVLEEHPDYLNQPWAIEELLEAKTLTTPAQSVVSVMTMHKSKGLEFDRVLLPAMGRPGRASARQLFVWAELPAKHAYGFLLGCAKGASKDELSLGEWLHEREKLALNDELKRLFYVAATRAKRALCITTSYAQGEPERCRPSAGSLLGQVSEIINPPLVWHEEKSADKPLPEQGQGMRPMRLTRFIPDVFPTLPVISNAHLEHEVKVFQDWQDTHAIVGSLVHKAFELAIKAGQLPVVDRYLSLRLTREAMDLGCPATVAASCVKEALETVALTAHNPEARCLFTGNEWDRYPEYNVASRVAGRLESYYLDLFMRSRENDDTWIVDFKTNKPEPFETLEVFEQRMRATYHSQLQTYFQLISTMVPSEPKVFLFLTHTQRFVAVDVTTPTGTA